jgi:hypothetical protein
MLQMEDFGNSKKLDRISFLLAANLMVMALGLIGLIVGLLPKLERVTESTERVEARFQEFADEVQPVVSAGAGKAVEAIKQIDAGRLSRTVTERSDELLDAAAEKARRFLNRDQADVQ